MVWVIQISIMLKIFNVGQSCGVRVLIEKGYVSGICFLYFIDILFNYVCIIVDL